MESLEKRKTATIYRTELTALTMKTHFKSNLVITELLVLGGRGISSINKCNKRQQMKRVTNSYL